jgi:ketosteroid isomerase-like protein
LTTLAISLPAVLQHLQVLEASPLVASEKERPGRGPAAAGPVVRNLRGPVDSEVRDLRITASEHVAFCHYLQRFRGPLASGGTLGMMVRYTTCLARTSGRWAVTHEHASAPIDPAKL